MTEKSSFLIAQLSDIHCGDLRFDETLMQNVISEINLANPDLVVIPGDLTAMGYRDQFEIAKSYLQKIKCQQKIVIAGNHDCRNVGYLHFEDVIGPRHHIQTLPFAIKHSGKLKKKIKLLAVDSNKPDLDDGEIGREKYNWIIKEFAKENIFKIFVLHHHLISIPGTGRERNIVWDAGDVLEKLKETQVDLVLAGHRHVPYIWPIAGMLIVTSGTASTWRTRGYTPPSYNLIEITASEIKVTNKNSAGKGKVEKVFPINTQ
jgi:3',5'-cyclic AMP phosphodiesterase CpdA